MGPARGRAVLRAGSPSGRLTGPATPTAIEMLEEQTALSLRKSLRIAARLCAAAEPDQILVAGVVRDLCSDGRIRAGLRDAGRATLKGFVSAVQVYALAWQEVGSEASQ